MTTNVLDLQGNPHTVRKCTREDIPIHFSLVKHLVPEDEHESYVTRMTLCMTANSAYCIDSSCFIYMRKTRPCIAEAFSLYGEGNPIKTLAMFAYILNEDKRLLKLSFHLHEGNTLSAFKSLITKTSLLRQVNPKHAIMARCDQLRSKLYDMYVRRGVPWVR